MRLDPVKKDLRSHKVRPLIAWWPRGFIPDSFLIDMYELKTTVQLNEYSIRFDFIQLRINDSQKRI